MCVHRDDEACSFNPWFEYLREVKELVRARLAAGEDPAAIRRTFRERIEAGDRGRPGAMLDRLRAVAALALDAVLPPEDRPAVAGSAGRRWRRTGAASGHRLSRR